QEQGEHADAEDEPRDQRRRVAARREEGGEAQPREEEERGADQEPDQQAGAAGADRFHAGSFGEGSGRGRATSYRDSPLAAPPTPPIIPADLFPTAGGELHAPAFHFG